MPVNIPAPLRLACRASPLARAQCESVKTALEAEHGAKLKITLHPVQTAADTSEQTRPLHAFAETGIFTKTVQAAVLAGEADVAVHSLKDLPTAAVKGLSIRAIPVRGYAHDVLVTKPQTPLPVKNTKKTTTSFSLGSASLRRQLMLKKAFPQFTVKSIRGNLATRLSKLSAGEYAGLCLAAAGLARLGLLDSPDFVITELPLRTLVPAPGQGALAIECRSRDLRTAALLRPLDHPATRLAVTIERRVLSRIGGGCHSPLGVYVEQQANALCIHGMAVNIATTRVKRMKLYADPNMPQNITAAIVKMGRQFRYFLRTR